MGELASLGLVLALIYLADCVTWVRRGAVALRARGRGFQVVLPSRYAGSVRSGVVIADPLPPLGTLFVAEAWPIAPAPDGFVAWPGLELDPRAPRDPDRPWRRWEDVRRIECAEREIRVDGRRFACAESAEHAERLALLLRRLRTAERQDREALIDTALAAALDPRAAPERVARFRAATGALRWATNALLVYLALAAPLVVWRLGFQLTWIWLAAGLSSAIAAVLVSFARAHRHLHPDRPSIPWRSIALLAFSPPEAVRALDLLARPLLADLHPLALVPLIAEDRQSDFVRRLLVDAAHPLPTPVRAVAEAREVEVWFGRLRRSRLEDAARRLGFSAEALLAPPPAASAKPRAWCPRCALQCEGDAPTCTSCGASTVVLDPARS